MLIQMWEKRRSQLTVLGDEIGPLVNEELQDDYEEDREIECQVVAHFSVSAYNIRFELAKVPQVGVGVFGGCCG